MASPPQPRAHQGLACDDDWVRSMGLQGMASQLQNLLEARLADEAKHRGCEAPRRRPVVARRMDFPAPYLTALEPASAALALDRVLARPLALLAHKGSGPAAALACLVVAGRIAEAFLNGLQPH